MQMLGNLSQAGLGLIHIFGRHGDISPFIPHPHGLGSEKQEVGQNAFLYDTESTELNSIG